jgi:predicted permease
MRSFLAGGGWTQDVRYGIRMLLKAPVTTTIAVLSLALGIGANTAIFSLIDAVLLKLLPVQDPQQLVSLTDPGASGISVGTQNGERSLLSHREYLAQRRSNQAFTDLIAAQSQVLRQNATIDGPTEELRTRLVSSNYFSALGVHVPIGRAFTEQDDRGVGAAPVAVISYSYWQRRFSGSSDAIGKTIRIRNAALNIVGVADPRFRGETVGDVPDIWIPLSMQPASLPGRIWLDDDPAHPFDKVMWLHVIGRLKPGVTMGQAKASVNLAHKQVVAEEFAALSPTDKVFKQSIELHAAAAGVSSVRGEFADPLFMLMGIVALVLLIACANVANLLSARAAARAKEIGVRLALGANRTRIIRQLLVESLLLAIAGGLLGVIFAYQGVQLLIVMAQSGQSRLDLDVTPDLRVLAFTAVVALSTGVLFGLAPSLRAARTDVNSSLKESSRGAGLSTSRIRFGRVLVTAQIALSLALLIGAGWFVQTLRNLQNIDLGYAKDHLVIARVDAQAAGYNAQRRAALYRDIASRLSTAPGIRSVAYSENGLFSGTESGDQIEVEGYTAKKEGDDGARFDGVGPNFFSTLGVPILLGREINERDGEGSPRVCVVNEAFARFYFGNASPIGKHVKDLFPATQVTMEIVGVVRDSRDHNIRGAIPRRFFVPAFRPMGDELSPFLNYTVRTSADPRTAIRTIQDTVRRINPIIPVSNTYTLDDLVDRRLRQETLIAQLSAAFGLLALILASIGLYGVLSYSVTQRTGEIGIRMALGAGRGSVLRMVLRETSFLIVAGLATGVPAALLAGRFVKSKLYGLEPGDPMTLVLAAAGLTLVAMFSGWLPARRAACIDPMNSLRAE